jgi:pimeloyl-ACP methyl ester carboxylesterase
MSTPKPFTVSIPQQDVDDLRRRLANTRWADDYANEDWRYGVERGWLERMVDYWAKDFDWRAQEARMNSFPQYRVEIDGLLVHYVHVRSLRDSAIPLILSHGWPWTFWDYKDMILPLAEAGFDVVVPSLPGIGFSPLRRPGVGIREFADTFVALMRDVLGYERFAAAGGDWGGSITAELGHAYPQYLIGIHMSTPSWLDYLNHDVSDYTEEEQWMLARRAVAGGMGAGLATMHGGSHATIQRIGQQTLAYAFVDSPVGTAAWLWERRRAWSEAVNDPLEVFDREFLCTNASIYWLTRTMGSSLRLYSDQYKHGWQRRHDRVPAIETPTGLAVYPKDILFAPRSVVERSTNLVRYTVMPLGGHYAASEQPAAAVAELTAFFRSLQSA